jgi:hypothetical protein
MSEKTLSRLMRWQRGCDGERILVPILLIAAIEGLDGWRASSADRSSPGSPEGIDDVWAYE